MIWIAFFVSVLYVCVGYALATYYYQYRGRGKPTDQDRIADELVQSGQAQEFLKSLQKLAAHVDEDVDRHTTAVNSINEELGELGELSPNGVLAAAKRLLDANQQLHTDLESARKQIQYQQAELTSYIEEARTDPLTGAYNRRAFEASLQKWFDRWEQQKTPLSVVLIDVDQFKQCNDQYGHQAGDEVLKQVVNSVAKAVRDVDVVARFGGDELAVLSPGLTLANSRQLAAQVHHAVAGLKIQFDRQEIPVSISVGVAATRIGEHKRDLVHRADAALYAAKKAGRNRVYSHSGTSCDPVALQKKVQVRHRVLIAPFVDGLFPEPELFREVECENLTSSGFQFLAPERPDFSEVLIQLGDDQTRLHMSATVVECVELETKGESGWLVSCRFTAPAQLPESESDIQSTTADPTADSVSSLA